MRTFLTQLEFSELIYMSSPSISALLAGRVPLEQTATVNGWVRTRRDSKAGFSFLALSDGSCFDTIQVVDHYTGAKEDRCFRLWRLRWPPGTLEALGTFRFLRVCPVQAPTRV